MNLRTDFETRKKEIEAYFELLQFLDSSTTENRLSNTEAQTFTIDLDLYKVMKANTFLMLYNLMEGTVVEGLNTIFLHINEQGLERKELSELYQIIWLEYKSNLIKKLESLKPDQYNPFAPYLLSNAIQDLDIFEVKDFKPKPNPKEQNPTLNADLSGYNAYIELVGKDISGNLDAREIRKLFPKYGINIEDVALIVEDADDTRDETRLDTKHILKVKNYRNKLAHGEESYTKIGAREGFFEINKIRKHVFKYLDEIVDSIENFLNDEKYKKSQ
ncbi:MAG: hypothetical protein RI894_1823 [Bacteroidota bacterium]|jgi:hypothetical protein